MKRYQVPAIKTMVNVMTASIIAASDNFNFNSDQTGVMPVIPGGGNPADAI